MLSNPVEYVQLAFLYYYFNTTLYTLSAALSTEYCIATEGFRMYENNKIQCTRQLLWRYPLIGLSSPAKIGYRLSAVPVETLSKH